MILRPAAPGDLPALASLMGELGYPSSEAQIAERLARLSRRNDMAVLVAEDEGAVIGFASVMAVDVIHVDPPAAMLVALVVAEARRGRGVGRMLAEAAEAWARAHGADRLTLASGHARRGAHAFYERIGYEHTARRYAKLLK